MAIFNIKPITKDKVTTVVEVVEKELVFPYEDNFYGVSIDQPNCFKDLAKIRIEGIYSKEELQQVVNVLQSFKDRFNWS